MSTIRKSIPIIYKYELVAIIADRAAEIAQSGVTTVQNPSTNDPYQLALLEFKANTLPRKIIRRMPDGSKGTWELKELRVMNMPQTTSF